MSNEVETVVEDSSEQVDVQENVLEVKTDSVAVE